MLIKKKFSHYRKIQILKNQQSCGKIFAHKSSGIYPFVSSEWTPKSKITMEKGKQFLSFVMYY